MAIACRWMIACAVSPWISVDVPGWSGKRSSTERRWAICRPRCSCTFLRVWVMPPGWTWTSMQRVPTSTIRSKASSRRWLARSRWPSVETSIAMNYPPRRGLCREFRRGNSVKWWWKSKKSPKEILRVKIITTFARCKDETLLESSFLFVMLVQKGKTHSRSWLKFRNNFKVKKIRRDV